MARQALALAGPNCLAGASTPCAVEKESAGYARSRRGLEARTAAQRTRSGTCQVPAVGCLLQRQGCYQAENTGLFPISLGKQGRQERVAAYTFHGSLRLPVRASLQFPARSAAGTKKGGLAAALRRFCHSLNCSLAAVPGHLPARQPSLRPPVKQEQRQAFQEVLRAVVASSLHPWGR